MADATLPHIEEPLAELERLLIPEYIRDAGEDPGDIRSREMSVRARCGHLPPCMPPRV